MVYTTDRQSLCMTMIKRYTPNNRQSEKLCNNWIDTAFNVCVDYVLPGHESSLWGRVRNFFYSRLPTALQIHTESYYVEPHEMDKNSCDSFLRKMHKNFLTEQRYRNSHGNSNLNHANFDMIYFASIFILAILFIIYNKFWKRNVEPSKPSKKKHRSGMKTPRKLRHINPLSSPMSAPANVNQNQGAENIIDDEVTMGIFIEKEEFVLPEGILKSRDTWIEPKAKVDCNAFQSLRDLSVSDDEFPLQLDNQKTNKKKRQTPNIIKRNVKNAKLGRAVPKRISISHESLNKREF